MGPEQRAVILIYIPTWASAKEGILIKINARGGGPIYSPQTAENIQFYLLRIEIPKPLWHFYDFSVFYLVTLPKECTKIAMYKYLGKIKKWKQYLSLKT